MTGIQCSTSTFHGTRPNAHFEEIRTSNTQLLYDNRIFTPLKHDFTRLGRVDGRLGRTLV